MSSLGAELESHLYALERDVVGQRPFSLYIHVPFCAHRCGYCDFNTYAIATLPSTAAQEWLLGVIEELKRARKLLPDTLPKISTVFFGGGTPTLMSPSYLGKILKVASDLFSLQSDCEVTVEANPETLDKKVLSELLEVGITRLSMGMQSSDPSVLSTLERVHRPRRALELVSLAHDVGFHDVSLDLIYGTPGETLEQWGRSLDDALSVNPEHLSAYALVIEERTAMGRALRNGRIDPVDEDLQADMYIVADEKLENAGYQAYEISNWAKGFAHRARHNMHYWTSDHWWGIGPGAHSHIGGIRWWNERSPMAYSRAVNNRLPIAGYEILSDEQRRIERILLEIRLADGMPIDLLTSSEYARLEQAINSSLIFIDKDRVVLTRRGRLLADALIRDLLD